PLGAGGPPPGLAGVRKTGGFNLPPPHLTGGSVPPPPLPQQPGFTFEAPSAFGSGSFVQPALIKTGARGGLYAVLALLALAIIGGTGYWYYWTVNKPGKIQLVTVPADATVLIDNAKVGEKSPVVVEKAPGPYTLSVTRDGYVRSDQNIEVRA